MLKTLKAEAINRYEVSHSFFSLDRDLTERITYQVCSKNNIGFCLNIEIIREHTIVWFNYFHCMLPYVS